VVVKHERLADIDTSCKIKIKPGKGNEFAAWLEKMQTYVKEHEPTTLEYTFARVSPESDVFAVWERYAGVEATKM
jgi:quinol monooxygenase YgiN